MLEFLKNFSVCSVQLFRQNALLVQLQMAKHLTEVPIYDVFHWSIDATEHHVVAATQRLRLNPQVHLKMREKVDVFSGLEGDKCY